MNAIPQIYLIALNYGAVGNSNHGPQVPISLTWINFNTRMAR